MSTTLLESIDHLNDALKDEASKRRWGRGLTYFRERASSAGRLDISSSIAPELIEFLSDRYGLKRNTQAQPATVRDAVEALEQECRRIIREDPVHCFTWGIVLGGDSPQIRFVDEFTKRTRWAQQPFSTSLMVETIWASLRLRTQRRLATTRSTG